MPELKSGWGVALSVTHLLLCVIVAVYVRRDRSHAPILLFLVGFLLVDWLRAITSSRLDAAIEPYVGADLIMLRADRLLYFAGAYGFAWLCGRMFANMFVTRAAWVGFVLVVVALVVAWPTGDLRLQQLGLNASQLFTLAICWIAAFRAALGPTELKPDLSHLVLFVLLAADTVAILVGYVDHRILGIDRTSSLWISIMATTFLAYLVCLALYGARLLGPNPDSAEPRR